MKANPHSSDIVYCALHRHLPLRGMTVDKLYSLGRPNLAPHAEGVGFDVREQTRCHSGKCSSPPTLMWQVFFHMFTV